MSQENVESVRRGYDARNQDEVESGPLDLDPEIEWRPRLGTAGVRATLYRRHEGVLAYKREVEEALGAIPVMCFRSRTLASALWQPSVLLLVVAFIGLSSHRDYGGR